MPYKDDTLAGIFERTDARCHLCGDTLTFHHYGCVGLRTAWEVDHDVPRAVGGDDEEENLLPAHVSCNRSKQALPSELVRAANGLSHRPMSAGERASARTEAAAGIGLLGAAAGAAIGASVEPPEGDRAAAAVKWGLVGGLVGAVLGAVIDPE